MWGLGYRVQGCNLMFRALGFGVFGFRAVGFGASRVLWVSGLGFRFVVFVVFWGLGFRVMRIRVYGF